MVSYFSSISEWKVAKNISVFLFASSSLLYKQEIKRVK